MSAYRSINFRIPSFEIMDRNTPEKVFINQTSGTNLKHIRHEMSIKKHIEMLMKKAQNYSEVKAFYKNAPKHIHRHQSHETSIHNLCGVLMKKPKNYDDEKAFAELSDEINEVRNTPEEIIPEWNMWSSPDLYIY